MNIISIVSKPIQYINSRNAVESYCSKDITSNHFKVLIVLDQFSGSDVFFKRVKEHDALWDLVIYSPSRLSAFIQLRKFKFDAVFSNSDISKDAILIKLFNFKSKLFLYEEGWGNYIPSALFNQGVLKKLIYSFLCFNKQYGASRLTNAIYLYSPNLTPSNVRLKCVSFSYDFHTYLTVNQVLLKKIFPVSDDFSLKNYRRNKVAFFLASKEWNNAFESLEVDKYDIVFIKPHPHTLDVNSDFIKGCDNVELIGNNVFLELEIAIEEHYFLKPIDVYHDNSMAGVYLLGTKAHIINIAQNSDSSVLSRFFLSFDNKS
jgi:hypothetical protein